MRGLALGCVGANTKAPPVLWARHSVMIALTQTRDPPLSMIYILIYKKGFTISKFQKRTSSPYSRWASVSLKKVREKLSVVTNRSSPCHHHHHQMKKRKGSEIVIH